ncbi:acyl-CoA carboxylase subunit epsilon [Arthrobacter agilis]|nr:hypothetical protein B8W74_13110 [Arthrobacter agilis]PPB45408.1 acyl-CoA carboxylase subunit epsilon [Arthrobacter agilis]TPV28120.1 acyl-CoA carboxylase subunit epsilon [Arthrobacter agilis]
MPTPPAHPAGAEDSGSVLSVVSGSPTDEELAALTAVVVALQGSEGADESQHQGRSWLRRTMLRLGPSPGPGSWRRSGR